MQMECSEFESVLEHPTQDHPGQFVNRFPELCDTMVHHDIDQHVPGKQMGVGADARLFPFPG